MHVTLERRASPAGVRVSVEDDGPVPVDAVRPRLRPRPRPRLGGSRRDRTRAGHRRDGRRTMGCRPDRPRQARLGRPRRPRRGARRRRAGRAGRDGRRAPSTLPPGWALVRLVECPVELSLQQDSHLDELVRELQLLSLDEGNDDSAALAEEIHGLLVSPTHARLAGRRAAERARAAGQATVDIEMAMPREFGGLVVRLEEAVKRADVLCEDGRLLTLASSPELRALRAWMTHEVLGADHRRGRARAVVGLAAPGLRPAVGQALARHSRGLAHAQQPELRWATCDAARDLDEKRPLVSERSLTYAGRRATPRQAPLARRPPCRPRRRHRPAAPRARAHGDDQADRRRGRSRGGHDLPGLRLQGRPGHRRGRGGARHGAVLRRPRVDRPRPGPADPPHGPVPAPAGPVPGDLPADERDGDGRPAQGPPAHGGRPSSRREDHGRRRRGGRRPAHLHARPARPHAPDADLLRDPPAHQRRAPAHARPDRRHAARRRAERRRTPECCSASSAPTSGRTPPRWPSSSRSSSSAPWPRSTCRASTPTSSTRASSPATPATSCATAG